MEIVGISDDILIINKPAGIPSQSDTSGDLDAMTLAREELRREGIPDGLWLVHRLDRVVGGLMLFARSKSAAAKLSAHFSEGRIEKQYIAVVEGEISDVTLTDYIRRDARMGRAFICKRDDRDAKEAVLSVHSLASLNTERGALSLVLVSLKTGRFHQIRAQLSNHGNPIAGDGKYGSRIRAEFPALFSHRVKIKSGLPFLNVGILPDKNKYPWSVFAELAPFKKTNDGEDMT